MKWLTHSPYASAVIALAFASLVRAESETQPWFSHFNWEAFVSQSVIYTNDYNFLSESNDNLSLDMWEAGVLFTTDIRGDLRFSAQLLGRKVSEFSDEDIRVDYAFFSYPFYQSGESTLGLRLGRIRSSYGFYNETRDIPHTRTGIVMPQSVYFDQTRNSFYSADGIEFFGFRDFDENRLSLQVFVSQPVADKDEAQEAADLQPENLEGDKSLLVKLGFGNEFDGWRAAVTYYRPEYEVDVRFPIPVAPFVLDDNNASFYSESVVSSLEYNQLQWSLTVEYLRHKFLTRIPELEAQGLAPAIGRGYEEAYYVQGLYRFNERWEGYLRYDSSHVRDNDDQAFPNGYFDDINVGASYRPDGHWLIRGELHYIEGLARLLDRDNRLTDDRYWTAAMLQVAYRW